MRNFDAANGSLAFVSAFRSVPLAASGQDEWRETEVVLQAGRARPGRRDHDRRRRRDPERRDHRDPRSGRAAAADRAAGAALAAEPAAGAGGRRRAAGELRLGRLRRLALERPRRRPAELRVAVRRRRRPAAAGRWSISIPDPAPTPRRCACSTLRARSAPARCGRSRCSSGGRRPRSTAARPGGRAGRDRSRFDGSGSRAGERPIARYFWDFYDGGSGEGQSASHAFAEPGRYIVTLRVEDDSSPPCNFSTAQQIVQVNARPAAVAGEDRRAVDRRRP